MKTNAQLHFETLKQLPSIKRVAWINKHFTDDLACENEWLDFKEGSHLDIPTSRDAIKSKWSKCVSAMANTSGGVVIWGIKAKKKSTTDGNTYDRAETESLLPNVKALHDLLRELTPNAVEPPVLGVEHIEILAKAPAGFLVSYIPFSESRPHRARWDKPQFYIRIGDHTDVPSVHLLRQLFAPVPRIKLVAKLCATKQISHLWLPVEVSIFNDGMHTAENLGIFLVVPEQQGIRVRLNDMHNPAQVGGELRHYRQLQDLHPGVRHKAFTLDIERPKFDFSNPPTIELKVASRHQPLLSVSIVLAQQLFDDSQHSFDFIERVP